MKESSSNSISFSQIIEKFPGITLDLVCEILPHRDISGNIIEYDYLDSKSNVSPQGFHKYGIGPFCHFRIPNGYNGKEGVYFIFEDDNKLKYIGETKNFETRFIEGYCRIDRRNCLSNGQMTNCRLNNLILSSIKGNHQIYLHFFETYDRKNIENKLIEQFSPPWNLLKGSQRSNDPLSQNNSIREDSSKPGGKYGPLYEYLNRAVNNRITLSYQEIERILGSSLPSSAYKYQQWWANDDPSHPHSKAWTNAGYRVVSIRLRNTIEFSKI
ncbi:GIY-YIG nuclease family protein [Methanospirillum sp. J.3.6.1-F.2.7.3]|uniref:GIY-YIG nuclease family protein n=1 Tax=Methanospirillum purgamenti TaxID=2834276 RepID=A0A8E7AWA7_9EURY|nr:MULTISPECIES: GIY-YIG nuclease family protein [Methanospirillum]MDX8551517.1 GIY-YIG nuclease family protein [Methanospirillum hungatei]QVV87925.1 GIY-YIG nuclease family protein [Methanospirillum sp. J.3.6.1-F.2.7.3]